MILLDSLYRILPEAQEPITLPEEGTAVYDVLLDGEHGIYAAHFPGSPITPGVCLVQMAVELLSCHLGREVVMQSLSGTKFLKPVCPDALHQLTFKIRYEKQGAGWHASCTILADKDVCARMKLKCRQS